MSNVNAGKINLLRDYGYTAAFMSEQLEETISKKNIEQNQYPLGILHAAQRLFKLSITYFNSRKNNNLGLSPRNYYSHPHAPLKTYFLINDINNCLDLRLETGKNSKALEIKIREFYNFSMTLDKPKKLNSKELLVASNLFQFFKQLTMAQEFLDGDKYTFAH